MSDEADMAMPSHYKEEYAEQAYRICLLLGATDAELGQIFDVSEQTINNWKKAHPEFKDALDRGKLGADSRVAERLYQRACGFEHEAVKIVADAKTGAEHIVPYTERYPPDTVAAIFWLKNRQRGKWRDKQEVEHSGEVGGVLRVPAFTDPGAWEERAKAQQQTVGHNRLNGNGDHP